MNYLSINNNIVLENDSKINITDPSFMFGQGLFETLKVEKNEIQFYDKHIKRLKNSLSFFGITLNDVNYDQSIKQLINQNNLQDEIIKAKILITFDFQNVINTIITTEKYIPHADSLYKTGVKLNVKKNIYSAPWAGFKSASYFYYNYCRGEAVKNGCFSSLLVNDNDEILEAVNANMIVYKNDIVFLPKSDGSRLDGVMEGVITEKFNRVEYRMINKSFLYGANIFITNSLIGIMPVKQIDFGGEIYDFHVDNEVFEQYISYPRKAE
ncbi:MAG: aminotransferase class IV [Elusimicrobiota bacterium]